MRRVVAEQRLGFVATVCPDGTPNLSPKGTTAVWNDDQLAFIDVRSPQTVANLQSNPSIEINVVDPFLRTGYRFTGTAEVLSEGPRFDEIVSFYRARGSRSEIRHAVLVTVSRASVLTSPAYDLGLSEDEISGQWEQHYDALRRGRRGDDGGRPPNTPSTIAP